MLQLCPRFRPFLDALSCRNGVNPPANNKSISWLWDTDFFIRASRISAMSPASPLEVQPRIFEHTHHCLLLPIIYKYFSRILAKPHVGTCVLSVNVTIFMLGARICCDEVYVAPGSSTPWHRTTMRLAPLGLLRQVYVTWYTSPCAWEQMRTSAIKMTESTSHILIPLLKKQDVGSLEFLWGISINIKYVEWSMMYFYHILFLALIYKY